MGVFILHSAKAPPHPRPNDQNWPSLSRQQGTLGYATIGTQHIVFQGPWESRSFIPDSAPPRCVLCLWFYRSCRMQNNLPHFKNPYNFIYSTKKVEPTTVRLTAIVGSFKLGVFILHSAMTKITKVSQGNMGHWGAQQHRYTQHPVCAESQHIVCTDRGRARALDS